DDFTRYGTYKYLRTDSTGYFYAKKIDGRWWMIDPDGYAGINMAVTSFSSAAIQNDYDITRRLGYNGTGNFLASESQTKSGYNLQNYPNFSFTRRLNFFLSYKNVRKNYYTTPSAVQGSLDHILVLDPQFEIYCDNLANTNVTPFVEERDLLGWFTDNEINFNQDQLRNLVKDLPVGDPSRNATLAWAAERGLSESDCINYTSKVTEALKQEFATYLAEHYFKTVSAAIRKYDTNHLILGSRFHGRPRAIPGVVAASHQYMDVTSVNFYDRWAPNEQIATASWTADKPCIVGEFYIKDINTQPVVQSGAGWYVNSQAHRGYFYQNTCIEFLKNKNYIGWHYFRFKDDDDGSNKGIVNNALVEYTDMTDYMEELNKQVYSLIDHFDGVNRRPESQIKTYTVNAIADTYVIPGSSNTDNFASATQLEVRHHTTEANRREAFLKFDLTSLKSKLPNLKNAVLEVSCTQTDLTARYLFASGISDVSWGETTLNGVVRQANNDWRLGYNRMSFLKGAVPQDKLVFDVTNWIYDQPDQAVVSFKILDITSTNTAIKIASREDANADLHPKLVLTFWDNSTNLPTFNKNNPVFSLFPNPASNILHIQGDDFAQAKLFSLKGEHLFSTKENNINVSQYTNGIYFLKILNTMGNTAFFKVSILN
ncbi:MAG: DNRLRE domain-containing protein, partial [Paludibacter sp.]|nr:DNRLRE domain-containing protein [Paludibacter sp.]